MECYDVLYDKQFTIIKQLHNQNFDSIRYFKYEKNSFLYEIKKDLIITASLDSHVKIIDFKKEESTILIDLNFESQVKRIINTAYFINEFEYILVPFSSNIQGTIHFYQYKSYCDKNYEYKFCINDNAGFILGLNHYYCNKNKINYALISNLEGIFSYIIKEMNSPELHFKFIPKFTEEEKENNGFDEAYVIEKDSQYILIGPCFYYGYLFFWDFFKGDLLYTMKLDSGISDISIWDNNYIFASLNHSVSLSQFCLINVNTKKIEEVFTVEDKEKRGCGIKVLRHKSKGNYLISSSINGKLNLYITNE